MTAPARPSPAVSGRRPARGRPAARPEPAPRSSRARGRASRSPRRGSTTPHPARPPSRVPCSPFSHTRTSCRSASARSRGVSHRTRRQRDVARDARRRAVLSSSGPRAPQLVAPAGPALRAAPAGRVPPTRSNSSRRSYSPSDVARSRRHPGPSAAASGGAAHPLGALAERVAARVQDLLGGARAPEAVDRVDRPPAPVARRGTRPTNFAPSEIGEQQQLLEERRQRAAVRTGWRARARRRGSGSGRRSRPSAPSRCPRPAPPPPARASSGTPSPHVEPEALVLERVHQLVGERDLEQRPRRARVADHDQALRAVVVEAEHLLLVHRVDRLRAGRSGGAAGRAASGPPRRCAAGAPGTRIARSRCTSSTASSRSRNSGRTGRSKRRPRSRSTRFATRATSASEKLRRRRGARVALSGRARARRPARATTAATTPPLVTAQRIALRTASRSSSAAERPLMRSTMRRPRSIVNSDGLLAQVPRRELRARRPSSGRCRCRSPCG